MEGYIQRREISNSVKMMRETYRELLSRYSDRTGKPFAKAPENLRPILEKIYNGVNVRTSVSLFSKATWRVFRTMWLSWLAIFVMPLATECQLKTAAELERASLLFPKLWLTA
jgi:hypothetical protein